MVCVKASRFSAKEQRDIVLAFVSGKTKAVEICREHQITPTTLYRGKETFLEAGLRGLEGDGPSDRETTLERENERLKSAIGDFAYANFLLKGGRPPSTGNTGGRT
ncbi:MAG: transposase [Methanobacteriota archaeon]